MTLTLALLTALAVATAPPAKPPLEVHYIDVGQGDAMLIRSPAGKTVLVDAGNIGAGGAVNDYLGRLGVKGLDLVIVSHPHLDHMGGMVEVLEQHAPKSYIDPGYAHPLDNYDALLDWLEAHEVPVKTARAGRTITLEPGITLTLFSPEVPMLEGTRSDCNSNSIVMRLVYGKTSFLFTGDSEDETEQRVMNRADHLESTVLKVAHHGGRHSTSEGWLAHVQPKFAVISAGDWNRYGHPTEETIGRLTSRHVKVFRTDTQGDIIARTDGNKIAWETTGERSAKIDERGGTRSYSREKPRDEHRAAKTPSIVDVNTADEALLDTLPGIGPKTAQKIIADRKKHGPYADLAAMMRVRGIGQKTVEKLEGLAVAKTDGKEPERPAPETVVVTRPVDSKEKAARPKARPAAAFRTTGSTPATATVKKPDAKTRLFADAPEARVNLNLADADSIARAAGIPLEQARLVVKQRQSTGPFRSLKTLAKVEGLGDAARRAIEESCAVKLGLNGATQAQLETLGLESKEALAVVEYRLKNGDYSSIDDLEYVDDLNPKTRLRVAPLLTVEHARGWN